MKKTMTAAAVSAAMLISVSGAVMAQDEEGDSTMKLSMGEISVKNGHNDEFRAGIAAWKDCYLENDGDGNWSVWSRMDGESGSYYVNFTMSKWAEMDEDDEASEACSSIVDDQISPHINSSNWRWAEAMPEISKNGGSGDIAVVYFFRVNDDRKFNSVVSEVSAAVREIEGDERGYWYQMYGGDEHAADYFIAIPFENFAEWDEDTAGVWELAAQHYGEEKTGQLRAEMREAMDAIWDYSYRRLPDLSHSDM